MFAVLATHQIIRFRVINELFVLGVEGQRSLETRGDISEVTERRGKVSRQRVGGQRGGASDRGTEVRNVGEIVLSLWFDIDLHGSIPFAANGELAATAEEHQSLRAMEFRATVTVMRIVGGPETLFVDQEPLATDFAIARVLERHLLGIGELLVVVEKELSPVCGYPRRVSLDPKPPTGVIQIVDSIISHVARAEVVPPCPAVVDAVGPVGNHGGWADPIVVVEVCGGGGLLPLSDRTSPLDVPALGYQAISNQPLANQADGLDHHPGAPTLGSVLNQCLVSGGGIH